MLDLLAQHGRISVADVSKELGVSAATVRRDFTELARQQLVTRTHGGVVAAGVAYDLPVRYRSPATDGPLELVAAAAAGLVEAHQVVGFNGGRTTSAAARRLAARADLAAIDSDPSITVVTNALNIATELVLRSHVRAVTLGGVARRESYELVGPLATSVLEQLSIDILFLGVDGVSAAGGASCRHDDEAGVNRGMVERSDRVVVLATGEKLGRRAFARICEAGQLSEVITDREAPPAEVEALRSCGVDVRIV